MSAKQVAERPTCTVWERERCTTKLAPPESVPLYRPDVSIGRAQNGDHVCSCDLAQKWSPCTWVALSDAAARARGGVGATTALAEGRGECHADRIDTPRPPPSVVADMRAPAQAACNIGF